MEESEGSAAGKDYDVEYSVSLVSCILSSRYGVLFQARRMMMVWNRDLKMRAENVNLL